MAENREALPRLSAAVNQAVADLCALAEEQPQNPHDPLSTRLYEIAHDLELAQVEPIVVARGSMGCTCGTSPFAPPEPASDCPHHGGPDV
jgi:hypothetical protein